MIALTEPTAFQAFWIFVNANRLWIIGVCCILLFVVLAAAGWFWYRKKPKTSKMRELQPSELLPPITESEGISVGKLHEQGERESQQDCFSVSPEKLMDSHGLLMVVADGMGGLRNGDKVSQTVVTTMMDDFYYLQGTPKAVLLTLLGRANQAVNKLLGPEHLGESGSTLVAAILKDGYFSFLSVGDSRISLFRDNALYQLNREHVYRNELYVRAANGECTISEAEGHARAAGLTSFLGMGQLKYVDLPAEPVKVRPGDVFVLMSDGVYNAVTREELMAALSNEPETAAQELRSTIQRKNFKNQDNYTAIIVRC